MMEKVDLKRAKFSGILDVLGFLAALVMTAGYIVIDLVKATGLPAALTNAWEKIGNGVEKAFDGVFLDWLGKFPIIPHCCLPLFSGFWPCCFCLWRLRLSVREIPC